MLTSKITPCDNYSISPKHGDIILGLHKIAIIVAI